MKKANISLENLKALRKMLPHGSIEVIAEKAGYHPNYVSMIFNGTVEINSENIKVIEEAQKVAELENKAINAQSKKLNDFLSNNKA